jgi:[lysine-biosynthesis-protein LysW]---L-2-aminoadipate ligase
VKLAIVSHSSSTTNLALADVRIPGVEAMLVDPRHALLELDAGDFALGRLDVRRDLTGVESGLRELEHLADAGVFVLNPPAALLAAHDKLLTARLLHRARLPHPRTGLVSPTLPWPELQPPIVVKPRFGSWGWGVVVCRDIAELARHRDALAGEPWFQQHGALVQELVPPLGYDLRLIVAGGRVVGAAQRQAAPGEWRTNVALGGIVVSVAPPPEAVALGLAAAAAARSDLVGIDLLPLQDGHWTILELNGAVEFRPQYAPRGNVFAAAIEALLERSAARPAA